MLGLKYRTQQSEAHRAFMAAHEVPTAEALYYHFETKSLREHKQKHKYRT